MEGLKPGPLAPPRVTPLYESILILKWPFFQEKVVVIECKFFKNSNTKCKILKDDYSRNSNNRQQGLYIIFLRVIWQWVWTKPKYFMVMGLKLKLVIVLHTSQENGMCHQYLNLLRMRFAFLNLTPKKVFHHETSICTTFHSKNVSLQFFN